MIWIYVLTSVSVLLGFISVRNIKRFIRAKEWHKETENLEFTPLFIFIDNLLIKYYATNIIITIGSALFLLAPTGLVTPNLVLIPTLAISALLMTPNVIKANGQQLKKIRDHYNTKLHAEEIAGRDHDNMINVQNAVQRVYDFKILTLNLIIFLVIYCMVLFK